MTLLVPPRLVYVDGFNTTVLHIFFNEGLFCLIGEERENVRVPECSACGQKRGKFFCGLLSSFTFRLTAHSFLCCQYPKNGRR